MDFLGKYNTFVKQYAKNKKRLPIVVSVTVANWLLLLGKLET